MLVSAFTPTHDPTYLADVYACLKEQTHQEWEWVIVPNGKAAPVIISLLQQWLAEDKRIKIAPAPGTMVGIGALKKFACEHCVGDLFLELDHDDLITHDCFAAVVAVAEKAGPEAFIFSDDVTLNEDGTSVRYGADYGWEHYPWTYKGKSYFVNKRYRVDPRTLCEILFAPDHVRVWTKTLYERIGGHNTKLAVGDDHELIVRSYLAKAEFHAIDRPLYIHKLRKNNTSIPRTKEIQTVSQQTRDRHLHDLVEEWCRRENLPKLDLGGAHGSPSGYLPVDIHLPDDHASGYKCDVFDLPNRLKPNSIGCIRAVDFLEHIPSTRVPALMNILYDLLVPGGWLLTRTPSIVGPEGQVGCGAWQDPTHVSGWSQNNWWYYTNKNYAHYVPEIRCRFQPVIVATGYPSDWHKQNLIPYVRADLCALKEGNKHWPGAKYI